MKSRSISPLPAKDRKALFRLREAQADIPIPLDRTKVRRKKKNLRPQGASQQREEMTRARGTIEGSGSNDGLMSDRIGGLAGNRHLRDPPIRRGEGSERKKPQKKGGEKGGPATYVDEERAEYLVGGWRRACASDKKKAAVLPAREMSTKLNKNGNQGRS